mgnify:CR=1 FL=1
METILILQDMERLPPMKFKIVTAFNENILKENGSKLLESFKNNWQPSIEFHCYYYDIDIKKYSLPKAKNIKYHNLENNDEYVSFIKNNKMHDGTEGGEIIYTEALDGLLAAPKVFAMSECAFNNEGSWLLWLDPMTITLKDIRLQTLENYFPNPEQNVDFVYMEDGDYFVAFNLTKQTPVDLLGDLRGAYISGEYLNYREWGSTFILSRLLTIYNAHGLKVYSSDSFKDLFANLKEKSTLSLRDSSGNRIIALSDTTTSPDILPNRYKQLADLIRFYKPQTILETGTWNGGRAIEMALAAFENTDAVHYIGYDLFEDATSEADKEENNVKPHNTEAAVSTRLTEFKEHMKKEKDKDFTYELHKGNVRDTLKNTYVDEVDFALIGSGNSEQTVRHEYETLKNIPVVIMDHFFTKEKEDDDTDTEAITIPDEAYQGVKKVFDSVTTKKVNAEKTTEDGWTKFDEKTSTRKHVLPSSDRVLPAGHTHLAVFLHTTEVADIPEDLKRVPIVVHPRDSVSKEYISNNIKTNMKVVSEDKWVQKHPPHRGVGVIISAGPYLDYTELKKFIKNNPECKIITVKHALPGLMKNGIVPWGCIVLDPRPITEKSTHNIVRQDLFADVSKDTNFFVASMTDPSVTNYLKGKGVKLWGWHAFTDSLRVEEDRGNTIQNQQVKINEDLGIPKGATLITGGTCAAMRSVGMLHTMGFRDLHLFGFDCCREEPSKEEMTETTGDIEGGETPKPKYIQVNVKDKAYWTTGELLAMAQDCEKVFSDPSLDGIICFHGKDTMIADLWEIKEQQDSRIKFKGYYDV